MELIRFLSARDIHGPLIYKVRAYQGNKVWILKIIHAGSSDCHFNLRNYQNAAVH